MANNQQEKTVGDILRIVFSQYKLFLAGVAIFIIVTMIISLQIPVKYTTTTTFQRQTDSASERIGTNKTESFNLMKLTLEDELCGNKAIERAADSLGMFKNLERNSDGQLTPKGKADQRRIIREIKAGLLVEWKVNTPVMDQIQLKFTYTDPHLVVAIPNTLVDYYINNVNGQIITRLKESRDFLKKQVEEGRVRLEEMTQKRIEFEKQYQDINLDNSAALQERINEMQADLESLYRESALAKRKTQQIQTRLANSRNTLIKEKIQELEKLLEEDLCIKQMTDAHPEVQKLRERIAQLYEQLQNGVYDETVTVNDKQLSALESGLLVQLLSAQGDEESINSEILRLEQRIKKNTEAMVKIIPLREEYSRIIQPIEQQESEIKRWNAVLTEVEMTLASEEANRRTQLKTIIPAQKQDNPQFPPFWTVLGIALGGGLAFGYFLAFIGDMSDHTIHNPREAAEKFASFEVPVVGVTNEIMTSKTRTLKHLKRFAVSLLMIVMISCVCASTYCLMWKLYDSPNDSGKSSAIPTAAVNQHQGNMPLLTIK